MIHAIQVLFVLIASTVTDVSPTGRKVLIHVVLKDCVGTPATVDVVLAGDEGTRRAMTPSQIPGDGAWVVQWTDERKRKFPRAPLSASVRFKDGRSYCQFAQPAKSEDNEELVANFVFNCDDAPVLNVRIGTIPPTIFSYERRLPRKPTPTVPHPCQCVEKGDAASGTRVVREVLFPLENFSVYFVNDAETSRSSDLLVLDPEGEDPAAGVPSIFDPFVRENAVKLGGDPRCKMEALCLQRKGIILALGQQRARARPALVPQAYSLDEKNLQKLSLLTLTVE
jgi:hypothetical protein